MPNTQEQVSPAAEAGGKTPVIKVVNAKCINVGKGGETRYICALQHEYKYLEIYWNKYGDEYAALHKKDFYVVDEDAYASELDYDYDGEETKVAICRDRDVIVVATDLTGHRVYTKIIDEEPGDEEHLDWQVSPASEDFEASVRDYYENYSEETVNRLIKLAKRCYKEVA